MLASFAAACSWIGNPLGTADLKPLRFAGTLAGTGREFGEPFGIAFLDGEIYVTDGDRSQIAKIDRDGTISVVASGLSTPSAIAASPDGSLIFADTGSNTVRRLKPDGKVESIAGIENVAGQTDGPAASAAFDHPVGVAVGANGAVFIADTYNDRIRVLENGVVRTIAGGKRGFADGQGTDARFDTPLGLTVERGGIVVVADAGNARLRAIDPDGTVWTLAGTGKVENRDGPLGSAAFVRPTAVSAAPNGNLIVADGHAIRVIGNRSLPVVETIAGGSRGLIEGPLTKSQFDRPSGLAVDRAGRLLVADSGNMVVRTISPESVPQITTEQRKALAFSPEEFRALQSPRWPFDPPERTREIAGTLGEIRGAMKPNDAEHVWFHNGLDIAGGYGETARFVRTESVLDPMAAENFNTTRELLRLPTMGYIHIRLGRDVNDRPFGDPRFKFDVDENGTPVSVRVPRGARFSAGEPVGTLNRLNHVHLIAGRTGAEMNALDALILPGVSDSILPVIDNVSFYRPDWSKIETSGRGGRINIAGDTRVVVEAYDRMDGNPERRKLGVYKLGYQVLKGNEPLSEMAWTISFALMPPPQAVRFAYASGSRSGYTPDTHFDYIVTNRLDGNSFEENFLKSDALQNGIYTLRVGAADRFGNTAYKEIEFEVAR